MARDLDRRIGALESGSGVIGVGDLLDVVGESGIDFDNPRTWPTAWAGRVIDPALLRALDALPPGFDRHSTEDVEARLNS